MEQESELSRRIEVLSLVDADGRPRARIAAPSDLCYARLGCTGINRSWGTAIMDVETVPITAEHVEGFHRCVDFVAHERKYLAFLEAPPLDSTHQFVMNNITKGYSQFVAIFDSNVVGWCDVIPKNRPAHAHSGVLGIGLLPAFRGRGNGFALIDATINDARSGESCVSN